MVSVGFEGVEVGNRDPSATNRFLTGTRTSSQRTLSVTVSRLVGFSTVLLHQVEIVEEGQGLDEGFVKIADRFSDV